MTAKHLVPKPLRPPLRRVGGLAQSVIASFWTLVRSRAFRRPDAMWLRVMGGRLRTVTGLEPPPPGSRRLEIGSGGRPRAGYLHVDVLPGSPSLDLLTSGEHLPLSDGWADELLAVHMIEHVPPPLLRATFREWRRVLREGGTLQIHTPNGRSFAHVLTSDGSIDPGTFWAIQNAMFGYGGHPRETQSPEALGHRGDHRALFTFASLKLLLEEAGFSSVRDVSGEDPCHHFIDWAPYVPGMCLEIDAQKDGSRSPSSAKR
jgi:SAM-dependent methyltransferase